MTILDYKNLLTLIKSTMKKENINLKSRMAINNISKKINNDFDESQLSKIGSDITILQNKIIENNDDEFGDKFNEKYNNKAIIRLGSIYFLMLNANPELFLSTNQNLLYEELNAMREVPYSKYNNCIKVLSYPQLVNRLLKYKNSNPEDASKVIIMVLSSLTSSVDIVKTSSNDSFIKSTIIQEVYPRIGVPTDLSQEEKVSLEIYLNRAFLLRNIHITEKNNKHLYETYKSKLKSISFLDRLSKEDIIAYLNFDKYIRTQTIIPNEIADLEVALLNIMKHIDIKGMSLGDVEELARDMVTTPISEYKSSLKKILK